MSGSDYAMRLKTTGRNERCPCGSGRKYKQCHLAADESARTEALKARQEEAKASAKASEDRDAKGDHKPANESTREAKRQKKQPGSKGRGPDGIPKNIPRRGAV